MPLADREIENLRAFIRLYGYVRYFHPTDAAVKTDWDRFAVEGSAAVRGAADREALRAALEGLFTSIAPTVVIYEPGREDGPRAMPLRQDGTDTAVVAWQHRGIGLGHPGPYRSVRTNRVDGQAPADNFAAFTQVPGAIFDYVPPVGTSVDKVLGAGLRARIPIALDDATASARVGSAEESSADQQTVVDEWDVSDENVRSAGIAIAWNLMQHFYPYFDVIDTDWDRVLTATLLDARDDESVDDYVRTLGRMIAELDDGHGAAYPAQQENLGRLPFRLRWIEDRAVATHSAVPDVLAGDVLLELDGERVNDLIGGNLNFVSGTLRWKRLRALAVLGKGTKGSPVRIKLDRSGEHVVVDIVRGSPGPVSYELKAIEELAGGISYVDLTRASWGDISQVLNELATARGVIFDLRGYPNSNHEILSHLVDEPIRSAIWNVPQIVYPDQERIVGWDRSGRWLMPPLEPRIEGKVVFITDANAISYAESFMGIVEHYELAEIVGEATAGANGNANWTTLPGGICVTWTGMRVLKHDETQHHLIGIEPTIPVRRTIEGVRSGTDELLAAAIRAVN